MTACKDRYISYCCYLLPSRRTLTIIISSIAIRLGSSSSRKANCIIVINYSLPIEVESNMNPIMCCNYIGFESVVFDDHAFRNDTPRNVI